MPGLAVLVGLFLWHAHRLRFVCDDAFISFRYAHNLVQGHGLVWNPGERVEGYTNFAWVMLMAGVEALGGDPEVGSIVLGHACGVATLLLVALWGSWLRRDSGAWVCLLAPAALASNRVFAGWASGGLETALYTLLLSLGLFLLGRDLEQRRPAWRSGLAFAALTLTRPEGVLCYAVATGAALVLFRSVRPLAWGALAFVPPVLLHLGFRVLYYGELLPNTFYAKVNIPLWEVGLGYLGLYARAYGLPVGGVLCCLGLFGGRGTPAFRHRLILVAVIAANLVTIAGIGGDFYEFRFVAPLLPAFFLLVQEALPVRPRSRQSVLHFTAILVVFSIFMILNSIPAIIGFRAPDDSTSPDPHSHFEAERMHIESYRRIAAWLGQYARPEETIAIMPAGLIPYATGLRAVDMVGLNDYEIARGPLVDLKLVGHQKLIDERILRDVRRVTFILRSATVTYRPFPAPRDICVRIAGAQYLCFGSALPRETMMQRLRDRGAMVIPCPPSPPCDLPDMW